MSQSWGYQGNFKQNAFVWRAEFGQRRTDLYYNESQRHVERQRRDSINPMSTSEIVLEFVENQCQGDPERYLYRTDQVALFLNRARMRHLRQVGASLAVDKVLLDDRNNSNVDRYNLSGNRRPHQGPLTPQLFYAQLMQTVSPWLRI